MHRSALFAVFFALMLIAAPSFGWGRDGHRIIGAIAEKHLTEKTKAAIKELLGDQTLADAGCWADEIRNDHKYDWAKPLHYINVPRDATDVDDERDCKGGACVIAAIERYAGDLRDQHKSREDRTEALKFLIHFVGDVHQPLDVSYSDDRGGNGVEVTWMGKPSSLHAVWDNNLVDQRLGREDWIALAAKLRENIAAVQLKQWQQGSMQPEDWADESLTITRRLYLELPKGGELDKAYYDRNIATVEDRLTAAGIRLARLLNSIFDGGTLVAQQTAQSQPSAIPADAADARSFLAIELKDECGDAGGQAVYVVNNHPTATIKVKLQSTVSVNNQPRSTTCSVLLRPGQRDRVGCSRIGRSKEGSMLVSWLILVASYRSEK